MKFRFNLGGAKWKLIVVLIILGGVISLLTTSLLPQQDSLPVNEGLENIGFIINQPDINDGVISVIISNLSNRLPELNESDKLKLETLLVESLYKSDLTSDDASSLVDNVAGLLSNASPVIDEAFLADLEVVANELVANTSPIHITYFKTITSESVNEVFERESLVVPCNPYMVYHYYGDEALNFIGFRTYMPYDSTYLRIGLCEEGAYKLLHVKPSDSSLMISPLKCDFGFNRTFINGKPMYPCVGDCEVNTSLSVKGDYYMIMLSGFNCSNLESYLNYSYYFLSRFI